MLDCFDIRQGMIFFVEDLSSEESVVFRGEDTPKKRRPWVIVSNDKANACLGHVTAVPIFTRTEVREPTQVYFRHRGRECVILCEHITSIPKHLVDTRGYVGTLSTPIFKQVQNAVMAHMTPITDYDEISNMLNTNIDKMMSTIDVKSIVIERICAMLTGSFVGTSITSNKNVTSMEASNTEFNDIINDAKCADTASETTVEPVSVPKKRGRKKKVVVQNDVVNECKKPRRTLGKRMSIEETMTFYLDCDILTPTELYEKWKEYGVTEVKTYQDKKKWVAKRRLIKEGLLNE